MNLDARTSEILHTFGFDEENFATMQRRVVEGQAGAEQNRIQGVVTPPSNEEVPPLPANKTPERVRLSELGLRAISKGEVGVVILAGGMATRFGGVVKASVEAAAGRSFLELKLLDAERAAERAAGRVPVYLMTSFATHAEVERLAAPLSTDSCPITCFPQYVSLRLTPEGEIWRDSEGSPSPYAPGHGDLSFALRRSGALDVFRAGGGKLLLMSNVDNLTATLDPAVIGAHLESGAEITVEVAPKKPGDKGGAPARVDGRTQIVEAFRFPEGFDQDMIPVFNTNTLVLDAEAIDRDFALTWFAVEKKVDARPALQFERLVGELTAFLSSSYLRVEREGLDARFQPVKDPPELERRRPSIIAALEARGIL